MKSLLKIGKLKLLGLGIILPILLAGTVAAYNIATPSKTTNNSVQTEHDTTPNKTDEQTNESEQIDTTPEDQTASEPSSSTSTQTAPRAPTATTAQPTQTATNIVPQQTATSSASSTPTCNESMKSSYTSLYNSKVNAENTSWYNQIEAWNNDAARRGVSFGGYVQSMINENKPAHDARLAQLQTQYYQNLASINCSP